MLSILLRLQQYKIVEMKLLAQQRDLQVLNSIFLNIFVGLLVCCMIFTWLGTYLFGSLLANSAWARQRSQASKIGGLGPIQTGPLVLPNEVKVNLWVKVWRFGFTSKVFIMNLLVIGDSSQKFIFSSWFWHKPWYSLAQLFSIHWLGNFSGP
jgi:hypothetical protein